MWIKLLLFWVVLNLIYFSFEYFHVPGSWLWSVLFLVASIVGSVLIGSSDGRTFHVSPPPDQKRRSG